MLRVINEYQLLANGMTVCYTEREQCMALTLCLGLDCQPRPALKVGAAV